jgi:hypothetical protein
VEGGRVTTVDEAALLAEVEALTRDWPGAVAGARGAGPPRAAAPPRDAPG